MSDGPDRRAVALRRTPRRRHRAARRASARTSRASWPNSAPRSSDSTRAPARRVQLNEFIEVDLSDPASIDHAVASIGGQVDALFNVAGVSSGIGNPLLVVTINFLGTRHFTEALVPTMPPGSSIASVSSLAASAYRENAGRCAGLLAPRRWTTASTGVSSNPEALADGGYRLSKEAIILYGMTSRGARCARYPDQLHRPGRDRHADPRPVASPPTARRISTTSPTPLGRVCEPDEQAAVLVFLNSRAASYITGQVMWVDGGTCGRDLAGRIASDDERKEPMMASMNDFRRVADDVRNWGRWGDDDELGTLNFITTEKVVEAAGLVRHGKVFPLGVDFGSSGPQGAFQFRQNPVHVMTSTAVTRRRCRVRPEVAAEPGRRTVERVLRRQPVPVQRRHHRHAAAGGHAVGCAVARLLRGQAVQRLSGGLGDQLRCVPLRDRQGRRQGHHVARGAARHRPAPRRRDLLRDRKPDHPGRTRRGRQAQGVTVRPGDIVLVRTGWWARFLQTGDGGEPGRGAGLDVRVMAARPRGGGRHSMCIGRKAPSTPDTGFSTIRLSAAAGER